MSPRPLSLAILLTAASPASAEDALTMDAVRYAQAGLSDPSITFKPRVSGSVAVTLGCGGKSYRLDTTISPGKNETIVLAGLQQGQYRCTGKLALTATDGTSGEMPLSVDITILPPLKLSAPRESLDLNGHTVVIRSDRPLSKVAVSVLGVGGSSIGSGENQVGGISETSLQWAQNGGEAIQLRITGWDEHGLPGELVLSPWSYDIPHEDVVFETAKYDVRQGEVPKLEGAWKELQDVLAKYGSIVEVRLFVGGYTDTVGPNGSNQVLSENRARAIASWFRTRGFDGEVSYQGFGESGLAVATADSVDEVRNRRAVYILAAEMPPLSTAMPSQSWKPLR